MNLTCCRNIEEELEAAYFKVWKNEFPASEKLLPLKSFIKTAHKNLLPTDYLEHLNQKGFSNQTNKH